MMVLDVALSWIILFSYSEQNQSDSLPLRAPTA